MKKVLIIGPFPDPISGVSIANKVVKELLSADSDFLVETINTSYPSFDEQIGKYKIIKELGSGGFGAVYLCYFGIANLPDAE